MEGTFHTEGRSGGVCLVAPSYKGIRRKPMSALELRLLVLKPLGAINSCQANALFAVT
jgi:hypothetical protein